MIKLQQYSFVCAPQPVQWAGAAALSMIFIPVVVRTTEDMLRTVPTTVREAALALGIAQWKATLRITVRTAWPGILTGILLAMSRIIGETAPLLFTALGNQFWQSHLDQPTAAVPLQVFTYAISPYEDWHRQAWAGALVLISIVLVIATQAKGSVLIHQKMFESRLFFVDKLIDMGAQIILCDPHRATVIGLDRRLPLRPANRPRPWSSPAPCARSRRSTHLTRSAWSMRKRCARAGR